MSSDLKKGLAKAVENIKAVKDAVKAASEKIKKDKEKG